MREIEITLHSKKRFKSRMRLSNPKQMRELASAAYEQGLSMNDLPDGRLKNFVFSRSGNNNRVMIFKEYVYVFKAKPPKLVTLYQLPNEYIGEYLSYDK